MSAQYFQQDYPKLASNLEQVSDLMIKSIKLKDGEVRSAIFDLFNVGGKMLRPAYCILFSGFTDLDKNLILNLAASIELLHTATLVHDDVIDKADKRRGIDTISHLYGDQIAIYAGDYLFAAAFRLLSQYTDKLTTITDQTNALERLIVGELGQMGSLYNTDQTIDEYIDNIAGKTGQLFATSCSLAPLVAGDIILAKLSNEIGLNIGIAFQILDDYLDYTSDKATFGKPVLEDMKQGIYSAPALYALEEYKRRNDDRLIETLKTKNYDEAHDLLIQSDALNKTKDLAKSYTNKALRLIDKLPNKTNHNSERLKEDIRNITSELLNRIK